MDGHFIDFLQENIAKIKRHDTLCSRQLRSYVGFQWSPSKLISCMVS
jgi:hypothetical protein